MLDIDYVVIKEGKHSGPAEGACILEVVSMLAGEPWSDHPACVCPVVGAGSRRLNDAYGDDDEGRTEAFRPLVRKLMGTRGSRELELRRAYVCADAAVRVFAPLALDASRLPELAAKLRAAPEIIDRESAIRARDIALEVRIAVSASANAAAYAADVSSANAVAAANAAAYAADVSSANAVAAANAAAYAASAAAATADAAADAATAAANAAAYAADVSSANAVAAANAAAATAHAAAATADAAADAAHADVANARRVVLAHGITLLTKLCDMKDEVAT